jgi:hypothetical protein
MSSNTSAVGSRGYPDVSVFNMLVRKKNSVDDMYYTIGAEDITVGHRGIIHLKIDQIVIKVFKTKVSRRIFGPKREEKEGRWGNYIMRNFIIVLLTKHC